MSERDLYLEEEEARELTELSLAPDDSTIVGAFSSDSLYHKTLQGKPIHGFLASATSAQGMQIDAINNTGIMNSGGVLITVDAEAIPTVTAQTFKTLIMLLTIATEQLPREDQISAEAIAKGRAIRISLEDYMRACKIRDKKSAREQLNTSILSLYGISLEWDEEEYIKPEGKSKHVRTQQHHMMRITDHTITPKEGNPIKRGVATVKLSYDMAEYLSGSYIMPYPSALLTVNTREHPYSISLGWKLCALDNTNITNNHPERVGRTTVSTLLKAASGIPRYETISHKGQVYRLIIERFDRDMSALVEAGVLSYYYYFDGMGNRIEPKQLGGLSYSEFSALGVAYQIAGYPDQKPRLEAKQKKITKAISRNKSKAAKRKAQAEGQTTMQEALS